MTAPHKLLAELSVLMELPPGSDVVEEAADALGFNGDIDAVDALDVLLELERRRAAGELVRSYRAGFGLLYLPPGMEGCDPDDLVDAGCLEVDAALARCAQDEPVGYLS